MGLKRTVLSFLFIYCTATILAQNNVVDSTLLKTKPLFGLKKIDSIRNAYYLPWKFIDTINYPSRYLTKVENIELEIKDQNTAVLSWDHHKTIDSFLVEMRYDLNKQLFHRKIYHKSSILVPRGQLYTIYPFYKNKLGKPAPAKNETIALKKDAYEGFWNFLASISLFLTIGMGIYHFIEKRKSK